MSLYWCPKWDLNPHGSRQRFLRPPCLPIPAFGQLVSMYCELAHRQATHLISSCFRVHNCGNVVRDAYPPSVATTILAHESLYRLAMSFNTSVSCGPAGPSGENRTHDFMLQESFRLPLKPPQFYIHQRYEYLVFVQKQDIHIAI